MPSARRQAGGRPLLLLSGGVMKIEVLLFHLILLAICGHSVATPTTIQQLDVAVFPANNTLSIMWEDTMNENFTSLTYVVAYNVSARSVLLFASGEVSYTPSEVEVMGSSGDFEVMGSSGEFALSVTNATYFVDGVTVTVSVQPVNDMMEGPVETAMANAGGIFAPPIMGLQATPTSSSPGVNFTWTVPYVLVPPDSYILDYNVTKLSGVELSVALSTDVVQFTDNDTTSSSDGGRMYTLSGLLFYSTYQFELTPVYGMDNSSVAMATATTIEGVSGPVRDLVVTFGAMSFDSLSNTYNVTANLQWAEPMEPNGNITSYRYTVAVATDPLNPIIDEMTSMTSAQPMFMVAPYTEYTFTVLAVTGGGQGIVQPLTMFSPEAAPSPAQNVIISSNSTHLISISWVAPANPNGIVNYTVEIVELNLLDNSTMVLQTNVTTELMLMVEYETRPYHEYTVTVTSQTSAGMGDAAMDSFATNEAAPSAPINPVVSTIQSTYAIIEWMPPEIPNGIIRNYTVMVTDTRDNSDTNFTTTELSANVTGLNPFVQYRIVVFATTVEVGERSRNFTFTTLQDKATPPQNLTTTPTNTSVLVQWELPVDANGIIFSYQVELFNDTGGLLNSTRTEALYVMFEDLSPFTNYSVEVRALTGQMNDEILGNEAVDSFVTEIGIPSAPNGLTVISGVGSLSVTWTPPLSLNAPSVTYEIEYTSLPSSMSNTSTTSDTMITLMDLRAFTLYSIRVQACSGVGCGPFTEAIVERTQEEAPSMPRFIVADPINSTTISVSWDAPEFSNGILRHYLVSYSGTSPGGMVTMDTVNTTDNSTSVLIGSLQPFTNYSVSVVAVTVAEGPPSDIAVVTTNETAPTGPPQQLMVTVNSTSITISWSPPLVNQTNGMIRSYIVNFFPTVDRTAEPNGMTTLSAEMISFSVGDLRPFTNYTFEVAAVTVERGPAATRVVRTAEAAPSAPTITEAVNTSSTSISVTWTPPTSPNGNIVRYIITYQPADGGSVRNEIVEDGMATMTELASLTIFTTYNISVQAVTVEAGDPSEVVVVTTDEDLPSEPSNFVAIELNSTSIMASWSDPVNRNGIVTHYLLNYTILAVDNSTMATNEVSSRIEALDNQITYSEVLVNLTEFRTYRVRVSAFTRIGEGNFSEQLVITDPAMASPPTDFEATAVNSTAIRLTWGYPMFPRGIIRGYIISNENDVIGNITLDVLNDMSNQSFVVDSLLPFTEYTFRVAAYAFNEGEEIVGAISEDTVQTLEATPSAPRSFSVTTVDGMSMRLSATWMIPSPTNGMIISYTVSCRENGTLDLYSSTIVTAPEMTSVEIQGLTPFTTYECFATANTSAGEGERSNTDTAITAEDAPVSPPQMLTGDFINSTSIQVTWAPPPVDDVNGLIREYIIRYFRVDSPSSVISQRTNETRVVIAELDEFTLYEVSVSAVTVAEGPTDSVQVRTDSDVPSQPLDVTIQDVQSRSFNVTWTPPTDFNAPAINYTLQLTGPSGAVINFTEINMTMILVEDLLPFSTYSLVVFAVSERGAGPASETQTTVTAEDVPDVPQNFTLETISGNPVQLLADWLPPLPTNGRITNYTLHCVPDYPMAENITEVLESDMLSFTLGGLTPFTNYSCHISASTVAGAGPFSDMVMAVTDESVPGIPVNFVVTEVQAKQISLSWEPPAVRNGILTGYVLNYFNTTHNITFDSELGADTQQFTVIFLNEFTMYTFELRAMTRIGRGEPAVVNQRTNQAAPSAPPQNVMGGFINSTAISITWSEPPLLDQNGDITEYRITYQKTDSTDTEVTPLSTVELFIEIGDLDPFTNYTVNVAARTIETGPFSDGTVVRTDSDRPTAPRNVAFTSRTRASINIEWMAPLQANGIIDSYSIEVIEIDSSQLVLNMSDVDMLEFNITGLLEYVEYGIVVFASTDKGRGPGSTAIIVRTLEHHPDEPTNFQISELTSTSLLVSWGPPSDPNGIIVSYHLNITLDPQDAAYLSEYMTMVNLSNTGTSYRVMGLHEYANYTFTLAAATSVGVGNVTEPLSRLTNEAAPLTGVMNITSPDITPTSVGMEWNPPIISDWNGRLTNYNISYRPVLNCMQRDEMLGYDVSSGTMSVAANPSEPRLAYMQSLDSPLTQNATVRDLEESVSYVFSILVRTSEGSSPVMEACFMTTPSVPETPDLSSFTILSNTTATVSWVPLPKIQHNGLLSGYVVRVTNMNTSLAVNYTATDTQSNLNLTNLVPFTNYTVEVAAVNQLGAGDFSQTMMDRTEEGVPNAPLGLQGSAVDTTTIQVSWMHPDITYGNLGMYLVTYRGLVKDMEEMSRETAETSIMLSGLNGDNTYEIEVRASTGAGLGNASIIQVVTPQGASPTVGYEEVPEIVPMATTDDSGKPAGVTSSSFVVQFEIVPEQEVNGRVDKFWIFVQRQPSTNPTIGTWYESDKATENWPQYAAVEMMRDEGSTGRKRATDNMQTVTVGGTDQCGPTDSPCNGPLAANAGYRVRYRLFSGDQSTDYDFSPQEFTTAPAPTDLVPIIIAIVVVVLVLVVLVAVVVVVVVLMKNKGKKRKFKVNGHNGDQSLLPRNESGTAIQFLGPSDPGIVPIHEMKEGGTPLKASEPRFPRHLQNTKIYLKDFNEHLKAMLDDSNYKFSEEYERVTEIGLEHAKEASLMAENRAKNRYTNILAYDHSRVKLSFIDDEPGSDYINASYIPGHRMRRAYVATQGPLPATFDDFWRMVWEQNTHIIVMLTQLVERGRTKCHRYWPGTEPSVYGDISVEMISEKEKEDWTIREFKLSVSDKRTRLVRHYQFTSWPDHGVPDSPIAALDFVKTVRSHVELHHGPLIVHCSAGVGRTGCFIALDTLQQHVRDNDWVDIYGLACEMRQHRNHMIQTEAQYVFIHKSMQEIIDSVATFGPGGSGSSAVGMISSTTHFPKAYSAGYTPGYSSVYCNPFAEEPSTTQMSDYYNDFLSEETHM